MEPARGENIGPAVHAIKTTDFKQLRQLNPGYMRAAQWVAHHSNEVLVQAMVVDCLEQALADEDRSIARQRLQKDRYVDADRCAELVTGKRLSVQRVAIVFVRETSGLTGDEVARCDLASSIPQAQPSLNQGQAVMVYAWVLRKRPTAVQIETDPTTFGHTHQALRIRPNENLHQWVEELLPLASDQELGLVRQLLRRIDLDNAPLVRSARRSAKVAQSTGKAMRSTL